MSGIEVAGLVLGAFPIVISGIQFYIDSCKKVDRWRKWEDVLSHLIRKIKAEYRIFKNICKRLDLEVLDDNQNQRQVTDEQIHGLEKRLGDSYDDFVAAAEEMHKILAKFRKKLSLDNTGNVRMSPNQM